MTQNDIATKIIGAAIKVHKKLGPGLLEKVYQVCLMYELNALGLNARSEVPIPVVYDDISLNCGFRIDLLVEDQVIVEIKSIEEFCPVHMAQMITYLKLSKKELGILMNFNVPLVKDGIKRVILTQ